MPQPPTSPDLPTGSEPVHRDYEPSCTATAITDNSKRSGDAGLATVQRGPSAPGTTMLIFDEYRIYNRLEPRSTLYELGHPLRLGFPVTVHRTIKLVDDVYIINYAPATRRLRIEMFDSTPGRINPRVVDMIFIEGHWALTDILSPMKALFTTSPVGIGLDGTVAVWLDWRGVPVARESEERLPDDRVVRQLELENLVLHGSDIDILVATWCATVVHSELTSQKLLKGETEIELSKGKKSQNPSMEERKDVESRKPSSLNGLLKFRRNKSD